MDRQFIRLIETVGYVNSDGQRVYGTAAVLHYLRIANRYIKDLNPDTINRGKAMAKKCIYA